MATFESGGTVAEQPNWRTCPACGVASRDSATFCRGCGAALPSLETTCISCGARTSSAARFCARCGTSLNGPPAAAAAPARRTAGGGEPPRISRRTLGIAAGILVVAGLAAGGAYWLRGDSGDGGNGGAAGDTGVLREAAVEVMGEEGRSEAGLPVRAPLRLTHPDGAVAEVPSSEYAFSDWVDIRKVELGDIGDGWEAHGSGWQFESRAGIITDGAIRVTIPDAGAGAGARVVALTSLGSWAEVPATREAGVFHFEVDGVPAPWTVTVATTRAVTYLEGDGPGEASAVEALYWSDREAWRKQELEWLARQDLTVAAPGEPLLVSTLAAPLPTYWDVKKDLDWALRMLGGTRATQDSGDAVPLGAASSAPSISQYQAGIAKLVAVRSAWVNGRYRMARDEGSEGDLTALRYDDSQTMDQAIESALANYAPWGVELTNHLLRSGYLASMDLRVIYGEAYFADVKLPAGAIDVVDKETTAVKTAGHRQEQRVLRLYSTRAVADTSIVDYLKDWKTEAFMRYLPIVLWQAGVVSGGPLLVGFVVIDQLLDWYQDTEQTAGDAYFYNQMQEYGVALQSANLVVDSTLDLIRTTYVAGATPQSQALGIAQLVYAMGVSYAVANTDWYLLKDVREVTEGSQAYCVQGQCNRVYAQNIPAIQVIATVSGDAELPKGAYPATRTRVMTWSMAFRGGSVRLEEGRPVYSPNLHALFHQESGASELWAQADTRSGYTGKEALNALDWQPYVESRWPDVIEHNTPGAQAIRVSVPKSYLQGVEKEFDIAPGSPIEKYGLVLRIEAADGERNVFELAEQAEPRTGDDKNSVYFSVVLTRDGDVSLEGLEEPYAGPDQVAEMQPLRRTLTGRISAHAQDEEDWLEFPIEFTGKNPVRQLDKEDFESTRVHFLDVSAEQKPVVYKGTTTQGLAIEILVDFKAKTWEIQKLETHTPAAACGDPNAEGLFEGGSRSEGSAEWGLARKGSKAVAAGSEQYVQALSILWLTGGNLQGNTLAWAPAPPEVAANAEPGESPEQAIREMWGADAFGTLDSSKRSISGALIVPFTDWFDCPAEKFSYTATR